MTNLLKTTLTVAALMTASTAAFAESMTAKIGFPFMAGGVHYPAATYRFDTLNRLSGTRIIRVATVGGKAASLMIPVPEYGTEAGVAKVVFRCSDDYGCHLRKVQFGETTGWEIRAKDVPRARLERMALVTVPLAEGKGN